MQIKPQIVIDSKDNPIPHPQQIQKVQSIIDKQIQFISQKLSRLNVQSDFTFQELNKCINYLLGEGNFQQKYLKSFFKRKYIEQIKLLNDFYQNAYTKSCINCLLFCCKLNWQKKFRIYKYTDESFEETIQDLPSQRRNMFYFVNLLYIRLFIVYQENCQKIRRIKNKDKDIDFSKIIVMVGQKNDNNQKNNQKQKQPKNDQKQPKTQTKVILRGQQLKQLQRRKKQIQQILQRDTKQIQNNKKVYSLNEDIKMLIEDQKQIEQLAKIEDTKIKTQHLFTEISTKSLDLRSFLIRKSRVKKNKYVLLPMYDNLIFFKFKFQFCNLQKSSQLQKKFEMFFLNCMRVAIKQKVMRMSNKNQDLNQKIFCLFLHLLENKQKSLINSQQFESVQSRQDEVRQKFWFQQLGADLIKAIIQVSKQKMQQKQKKQSSLLLRRKKQGQASKFKDPLELQLKISKPSIKPYQKPSIKPYSKPIYIKNPQDIGFVDSSRQFLTTSNQI